MSARSHGSPAPPLTGRVLAASLLFLLWMESGYAAALAGVAHLPVATAVWQGAVCLVAVPLLLLAVVRLVSLPKHFPRLPKSVLDFLWALGTVAELVLPWLGWSTLLWWLNGGAWTSALGPGGVVAAFSYLTGVAILWRFGPRPQDVQITRLEITIPGLPRVFDGYRILHVSDLHASVYLPAARLCARLAVATEEPRDLMVFTGDLTSDLSRLDGAAQALATLTARDGALAVLGNHDNWLSGRAVREALRRHGIHPLVNAHYAIEHDGERLILAGVDNPAYADRDDLSAALEGVNEEEEVVLLLCHAPEIILRPRAARAALVLAGHTHGGQIVLPLVGALYVPSRLGRRFASGLHPLDHGWLYINRGLGEIFPPLRVLCPPELAVLTLRSYAQLAPPGIGSTQGVAASSLPTGV